MPAFQQAIKLDPNNAAYRNNLGVALSEVGRPADCLEHFEAAVRLQPEHAEAHKSRALNWLHLGDYERGWAENAGRAQMQRPQPSYVPAARVGRQLFSGKRILLYTEQGIGDTFQFIRYAPLLADRRALVAVECPGSLVSILETCPKIAQVIAQGPPLPDFDCHAPLMSLPRLFGTTTLANVPANIPYLSADQRLAERWRRELGTGKAFKVGVVWQGNPGNGADRRR